VRYERKQGKIEKNKTNAIHMYAIHMKQALKLTKRTTLHIDQSQFNIFSMSKTRLWLCSVVTNHHT